MPCLWVTQIRIRIRPTHPILLLLDRSDLLKLFLHPLVDRLCTLTRLLTRIEPVRLFPTKSWDLPRSDPKTTKSFIRVVAIPRTGGISLLPLLPRMAVDGQPLLPITTFGRVVYLAGQLVIMVSTSCIIHHGTQLHLRM